jgi:hypothetical protein
MTRQTANRHSSDLKLNVELLAVFVSDEFYDTSSEKIKSPGSLQPKASIFEN